MHVAFDIYSHNTSDEQKALCIRIQRKHQNFVWTRQTFDAFFSIPIVTSKREVENIMRQPENTIAKAFNVKWSSIQG